MNMSFMFHPWIDVFKMRKCYVELSCESLYGCVYVRMDVICDFVKLNTPQLNKKVFQMNMRSQITVMIS